MFREIKPSELRVGMECKIYIRNIDLTNRPTVKIYSIRNGKFTITPYEFSLQIDISQLIKVELYEECDLGI